MATSTFIPVEEYLRQNYRPNCEVPGTPIRIPLAGINAELDDIAAGR